MYEKQYGPHTCLFLLVGKFYELYDILSKETGEGQTNVRHAVETLGITLTTKKADGPNKEDCLFAGFPEQSLQKFAGILTREGWTLVVADQKKNSKGLLKILVPELVLVAACIPPIPWQLLLKHWE